MSGRAGFLELETKSKPARERGPRGPGARLPSGCRFPDSAEHVFCGCHAAGRRGAVGSSWPGPRLPSGPDGGAGGRGSGRARAHGPLPIPPPAVPLPAARRAAPAGPTLRAPFQLAVQGRLARGSPAPGQGGSGLQMGGQPRRGHRLPRDHPPGLEPGSACPLGTLVSPCPLIPANRRWGGLGCWPSWVSIHWEHTYHSAPRSSVMLDARDRG